MLGVVAARDLSGGMRRPVVDKAFTVNFGCGNCGSLGSQTFAVPSFVTQCGRGGPVKISRSEAETLEETNVLTCQYCGAEYGLEVLNRLPRVY